MRALRWSSFATLLVLLLFVSGPDHTLEAATIYDESVSGDLSDSGLTPTRLTFGAGSNRVIGTTGRGTAVDREYFSFTVPSGLALTSITLLSNTTFAGVGFFGLQAGPQVTLPVTATSAAGLLGWSHYGVADVNTNLLVGMAIPANNSSGFTIPLGPGTYSVWEQEFSAGSFSYGFDFTLVPEPSPAGLVVAGIAAILGFRRRWATS